MKIRTMFGLGLLGTALYAHKKRGGDMSIDSMKDSMKALWAGIQNKAIDAKDKVENLTEQAKQNVKDAQEVEAQERAENPEFRDELRDEPGFGTSGYTGGGGVIGQRH
ncbi:MAG: hypothetical protein AB7O24_26040 [Kofleriaceae bacterium]